MGPLSYIIRGVGCCGAQAQVTLCIVIVMHGSGTVQDLTLVKGAKGGELFLPFHISFMQRSSSVSSVQLLLKKVY